MRPCGPQCGGPDDELEAFASEEDAFLSGDGEFLSGAEPLEECLPDEGVDDGEAEECLTDDGFY